MAGVAAGFYATNAWKACRIAFAASRQGLCERCLLKGLVVAGEQVHHKVRITAENVGDPNVTLNWENLELLCKQCHIDEHNERRYRTDELGRVEL